MKKDVSDKLNDIIEDLKENGFPKIVSLEDLKEKPQCLYDLVGKHQEEIKEFGENSKYVPEARVIFRKQIRDIARTAVEEGLLKIKFVKDMAIFYGAIPSPENNFKYFYTLDNSGMQCWDCGEEIRAVNRIISIHDGPFPMSGSGKTRTEQIPYCVGCEKKPSDRGIDKVDFCSGLVKEHQKIAGKG